MATYTFDKIDYGGNTYVVQDSGALQLTGGNVTGPVTFGDSITVDEATLGDLVVNGNASFTNNIQANRINGITVGSSPKFTDTNYYHTTGSWSGLTYTATANGGAGALAFTIPTGNTSTTVAIGNHSHNYIPWHSDLTSLGSGSPAAATQTYWTDMLFNKSVIIGYNTSGTEYTLIFSRGSSANYGSVIKYGYNDLYFYTMRKGGSSTWKDSDWVKMNAGYADSAGSVAWSNVSDKPTIPAITLNGSATTSPSFYAPTGAGTSGQFLKSSGSGQPTWSTVTIPTITQNGSATTTPSFYAPVTAGTSGHVLKSNGSGAPTWTSATLTDTMVTTAALTSGTTYYPILATGTGTATRQIDSTLGGLKYTSAAGTTSAIGSATLQLGNATASGTTNNEQGILKLYGTNSYVTSLRSGTPTASRTIDLPDWSGTVALTNYTVGDYTYLNFSPSVEEVDGSYAFAEYRLSASSWDGTNYRVLNYVLGSNDFQIYSQTLEKTLIHVRNFTNSSYDNYVSIRKLCTPTQDDDAATKKYVDDAALKTVVVTPTVTASTGTKVSAEMRKYGNVVQFTLTFKNTSSVASGSEVFVGTLSTNKPLQLIDSACYFGSHALVMSINTSGGITIRNASNSAVTCNSNTMIGATWLV